jgi:hypothetical protein
MGLLGATDHSHPGFVAIIHRLTNSARLGISPQHGESRIVASYNADAWQRGSHTPGGLIQLRRTGREPLVATTGQKHELREEMQWHGLSP